jgi:hypothetical protein
MERARRTPHAIPFSQMRCVADGSEEQLFLTEKLRWLCFGGYDLCERDLASWDVLGEEQVSKSAKNRSA